MDYIINPFPGGSSLGMPPSFYPVLGIAGQAYEVDSNGNVITDDNGNPYIINTSSSGSAPVVKTTSNPNVINNNIVIIELIVFFMFFSYDGLLDLTIHYISY